jgi:hypothetical protein
MGLKFQPLVFSGLTIGGGGASLAIGSTVSGADADSVLIVDNAGKLADVVLTNGQIVIGRTGNTPVAATLTGTSNQVIVTPGSGTITLSLPQSIGVSSSPTFANLGLAPSGVIDLTSSGTLSIGVTNASIINIGNTGATINIQGDTFYQNVTDLNVKDKNITVNYGGSAGTGFNSGINVQENSVITGYLDTTLDRTGWELKAPATAGIVTITPGFSGFTLDQESHNPVTIGTANGLSLSTQVLSLAAADGSNPGALTATTQTIGGNKTFNGSISASNLSGSNTGDQTITLSGDASGSGTGAITVTLATVNSNVGSFGTASSVSTFTVNGKGLITAASNTSIAIATSQITSGQLSVTRGGTGIDGSSAGNGNLLIGNGSGYSLATLSAGTGISVSNGSGTISIANTFVNTGDIASTTWSSLANNTANQTITGLAFSTSIKSFETLINIFIDATTDLYTTVKLTGTRNSSDWTGGALQAEFSGDSITGLNFTISTSGQVKIDIGSITGFTSGTLTFRAITL